MKCVSPESIIKPGQTDQKVRVTIPCGKCGGCLSNKRNSWSFRLQQEWNSSKSAFIVTLTYDNENLPLSSKGYPTLNKKDFQNFIKKLRYEQELAEEQNKILPKSWKNWKIRYYGVGEYGPTTCRPHYHVLLFNIYPRIVQGYNRTGAGKGLEKIDITKCWKKGNTKVDLVTGASIHYVTKYFLTNVDEKFKYMCKELGMESERAFMSTKPAIGIKYLQEAGWYHKLNKEHMARFQNGKQIKLPRFYKDRIFNLKEMEENKDDTIRFIWETEDENIKKIGYEPYMAAEWQRKQAINRKLNEAIKKSKL